MNLNSDDSTFVCLSAILIEKIYRVAHLSRSPSFLSDYFACLVSVFLSLSVFFLSFSLHSLYFFLAFLPTFAFLSIFVSFSPWLSLRPCLFYLHSLSSLSLLFLLCVFFCPRRTVFVGGLWSSLFVVVCPWVGEWVSLRPSHIFGSRLQNFMKLCWCCLLVNRSMCTNFQKNS